MGRKEMVAAAAAVILLIVWCVSLTQDFKLSNGELVAVSLEGKIENKIGSRTNDMVDNGTSDQQLLQLEGEEEEAQLQQSENVPLDDNSHKTLESRNVSEIMRRQYNGTKDNDGAKGINFTLEEQRQQQQAEQQQEDQQQELQERPQQSMNVSLKDNREKNLDNRNVSKIVRKESNGTNDENGTKGINFTLDEQQQQQAEQQQEEQQPQLSQQSMNASLNDTTQRGPDPRNVSEAVSRQHNGTKDSNLTLEEQQQSDQQEEEQEEQEQLHHEEQQQQQQQQSQHVLANGNSLEGLNPRKVSEIMSRDYNGTNDNTFTLEDFLSDVYLKSHLINYTFTPRSECPAFPDNYTLTTPVPSFTRYERVVLATKIHDEGHLTELKQAMCLLHAAYNHQLLYDYIIFHTENITDSDKQDLQQIVHPASVQWVRDSKSLHEELADLTPAQRKTLLERCNQPGNNHTSTDELTWRHRCQDMRFIMPLAYNWMSEFRAKWVWRRPELRPYKYMMWFDADTFPMVAWREDPIEYMVKNKMALLMGAYGGSKTKALTGVKFRIREVYYDTICQMYPSGTRFTVNKQRNSCLRRGRIFHAHGFFHITDLDFYRLPINIRWGDVVIGDGKYQRVWDDQLAVVVPPAMLAEKQMATLSQAGICPFIMHNLRVMDTTETRDATCGYRGYLGYWHRDGQKFFPEARDKCSAFIKVGHRRV